jgi:hypothetical protein
VTSRETPLTTTRYQGRSGCITPSLWASGRREAV